MGQFSQEEIERGMARLDERIANLRAFDVRTAAKGNPPSLEGLQSDIADTLERIFGRDTSAYRRFQGAAHLIVPAQGGGFFGLRPIHEYYPDELAKNIGRSIALLEAAQRVLREDLADAQHAMASLPAPTGPETSALSRRVFVVHGHDGEAREMVARFLRAMDFEPIILHEQPNQGGTVIEKFEANSEVGFAVVLLTPDDLGRSLKEDELKPRARQNVLLELGYFIGHLGRDKVCALKRGDVELPSDYVGVVWEKMDDGGGWKLALARELKAAGHVIDGNKVI